MRQIFKYDKPRLTFPATRLVVLLVICYAALGVSAQQIQKKQLLAEDYQLWNSTSLDRVSADEQWVTYRVSYENGLDTLYLKNIVNGKTFSYPGGGEVVFSKNDAFMCLTKTGLHILDLKTGKSDFVPDVIKYAYAEPTDLLIIQLVDNDNKKQLILKSPSGKIRQQITDVSSFSLSPTQQQLIFNAGSKGRQRLCVFNDLKKTDVFEVLPVSDKDFVQFTWQKQGKALAFLSQAADKSLHSLFYYILEAKKLYELDSATLEGQIKEVVLVSNTAFKLIVSDDLERVFFAIKKRKNTSISIPGSDVEIWNGNDKWIFSQENIQGKFENTVKIALWLPKLNTCFPLSTPELPKIMISGNQQHAVLSNPKDYEPQFDYQGERDYYLMDLKTQQKHVFLKKQSAGLFDVIPSPEGRYIAYFKDNNWWTYHIDTKIHKNITASIGGKFTGHEEQLSPDVACGNPGWTKAEKEIVIYDEYDLWAINPQLNSFTRLTRGRESKIKFRIAPRPNIWPLDIIYEGVVNDIYDLDRGLFLRGEGEDGKTGYFSWKKETLEIPLVYGNSKADELLYGPKKQSIFYREQKFELSPRLMVKKPSAVAKPFFQSNEQQQNYHWGKSELLSYQNSRGDSLKGVLIYPANYDPTIKYPMVVHIYERQSEQLHDYVNPTWYGDIGFNLSILSSKGYFVLLPDIKHENGAVGISATDCVIAATQKVINLGLVDKGKIGLMGHSFGGYETAFIITQTNLFATAIASGGITDLKSFFLTVSGHTGKGDMWRFQTMQWRMGKSFYEAPRAYYLNSPLEHAEKLKTPLLLWSGKEDRQVDPDQSISYHLALRRLGKKNIMLLYPKEGHVVQKPVNQQDLSIRVEQWFDYYLKDIKTVDWISKGTK